MSDFLIYFEIGLHHVLDVSGYEHLLFLMALTVPYAFKDWKRILLLISIFTLGHTLAVILSLFKVVIIKAGLAEFLVPVTILLLALYNLFTAGKLVKNDNVNLMVFITITFGIIHGLAFSEYFNSMMSGEATDKLIPLVDFGLGIEFGQGIIVLMVLLIWFIMHHFGRFSKRDFSLVMSAFVTGVVVPMILGDKIWNY